MTQDNASPATLSALLARNLDLRGESVAFVEGEREITYREFDGMVRCSAAWLAGQGVKPGDRVAVWLVNRIEWLALYFGLARLGAALMTVNTRYRTHELAYILERSQASLLVLQLNFRKIDFPAVLRDVPLEAALALRKVVVVDAGEDMPAQVLGRPTIRFDLAALPDAGMPDADTPDHAAPDSPCVLFTTSGTTSGPKLVVHTQYTAPRLCGTFGLSGVMAAFAAGRPVVLMDTFDGPEAARLLNAQRITHLFGSDEMFQRIIESAPAGDRPFPHARVFGFASFQPGTQEVMHGAW